MVVRAVKTIIATIVVALLLASTSVSAEEYANRRALADIKSVSVYFDVNVGVPAQKLVTRLMLIDKTSSQLAKAGVKAQFVIGFRGKASYFVTKGDDYVLKEDIDVKKKVVQWVKDFKARGIVMEQCLIAAEFLKIRVEDFLPEIEIVENGYVSMIGYQAKGYSLVPMD